jgi:hypothetical protein
MRQLARTERPSGACSVRQVAPTMNAKWRARVRQPHPPRLPPGYQGTTIVVTLRPGSVVVTVRVEELSTGAGAGARLDVALVV